MRGNVIKKYKILTGLTCFLSLGIKIWESVRTAMIRHWFHVKDSKSLEFSTLDSFGGLVAKCNQVFNDILFDIKGIIVQESGAR